MQCEMVNENALCGWEQGKKVLIFQVRNDQSTQIMFNQLNNL